MIEKSKKLKRIQVASIALLTALSRCRPCDEIWAKTAVSQKTADGSWVTPVKNRHASSRAASCLR